MKVTQAQIQNAATSPAMSKAIAALINEALECSDLRVQTSAQVVACFMPSAKEKSECTN